MKKLIKKISIAIAFIFATLIFSLLSIIFSKSTASLAYTSATMPSGANHIGQIYNSTTGKFDDGNLNKLAGEAGYSTFTAMVTAAKNGTKLTSDQFGNTVLDFGTYNGGNLTWIPAYVSQSELDTNGDGKKDPILTLWLADTDSSNTGNKQQEVSAFSDGTFAANETKLFNSDMVYSNTYDSSYLRNYVLNGSNIYAGNFGNGTPVTPPAANLMTKFTQFTTGALSGYLVSPKDVIWQMNASYMKNDPAWNASGYTTDASGAQESNTIKGTAANYPSAWTNDKIWLPSIYETYDSTITPMGTRRWDFVENGGLWNVSTEEIFSSKRCWLRSGDAVNTIGTHTLGNNTIYYYDSNRVDTATNSIRPALHLNLSSFNVCQHTSATKVAEVPATCTATGTGTYWSCPDCGLKLADNNGTIDPETAVTLADLVIPVNSSAHNYDTANWSYNATNHWHACTLNSNHAHLDEAAHDWDNTNCTSVSDSQHSISYCIIR